MEWWLHGSCPSSSFRIEVMCTSPGLRIQRNSQTDHLLCEARCVGYGRQVVGQSGSLLHRNTLAGIPCLTSLCQCIFPGLYFAGPWRDICHMASASASSCFRREPSDKFLLPRHPGCRFLSTFEGAKERHFAHPVLLAGSTPKKRWSAD